MVLNFSDESVARREIGYAESVRRKRLAISERQVESFTSKFWDSYHGTEEDAEVTYSPENAYLEFVALMLPRVAFSNPRVDVTSARLGPQEEVAIAMKHGINRWVTDSSFAAKAGRLAVDYFFNHCVAHVSMVEHSTMSVDHNEVNPLWPEITRISPHDFFRDPQAKDIDEVRFAGHGYLIDKEDLLEIAKDENKEDSDAGWDIKTIEGIPPGWGDEEEGVEHGLPDREQLLIKEVWVAGYEDDKHPGADEGYHGSVFTYAFPATQADEETEPIMIRGLQPYYGPSWGPYVVGDMYYVPDSPYGLSSLVAQEGQIRDMNRHANAMSDSAARYKRLVFADNTDPLFSQKVKDGEHDYVFGIEGLDKAKILQMEIGGVTGEWINYFALSKDRVDRGLGISDTMKGQPKSGNTATADALADQAGDTRIAWIKHQYVTFVEKLLTAVGWYMYHNDDIKFPIGRDAADELGVEDPETVLMFEGGSPDRESGASFEDLELRIQVMSMEHTSEATLQRRALQLLEILTMVAQIAPTAPYMNWKDILQNVGSGLNIPVLGDVFDEEVYGQMVGMAIQEQQAGMEAQLGKHAKKEEEPQVAALPFMQGRSTGSMFGATTGAAGGGQGA